MANRVTMTICGTEYTLIAEEDAAYMEKVGALVDKEMRELMDTAHMSRDNAGGAGGGDLGRPALQGAGRLGKPAAAAENVSGRGQPG